MRTVRLALLTLFAALALVLLGTAVATAQEDVVQGTVTAADSDLPLADVEVCPYRFIDDGEDLGWYRSGACATTDEAGQYSLVVGNVGVRLSFEDPSAEYSTVFNDGAWSVEQAPTIEAGQGATVDVKMTPAGGIDGVVTNGERQGVRGVQVCATPSLGNGDLPRCDKTDSQGAFSITQLVAGDYIVSGEKRGYGITFFPSGTEVDDATAVSVTPRSVTQADFTLLRAPGSIAGTVTAPDGSPLSGVWVWSSQGGSAVTDEFGDYALEDLPAASYILYFSPPYSSGLVSEYYQDAYEYSKARPVAVGAGEVVTGIDVTLEQGATISGVVKDDVGAVAVSVPVRLRTSLEYGTTYGSTTQPDGTFSFTGLAPGSYYVQAGPTVAGLRETYHEDGQGQPAKITVSPGEAQTADVNLRPGGQLRLTVTDGQGVAVPSNISVMPQESSTGTSWYGSTNAEGQFTSAGLVDGRYRVRIDPISEDYATSFWRNAGTWNSAELVEISGDRDIELSPIVKRSGQISGSFSFANDSSGRVSVWATSLTNGNGYWASVDQSAKTYSLRKLPADTYRLQFERCQDSGYGYCMNGSDESLYWDNRTEQSQADGIVVAEGSAITGKDVVFGNSANISGDLPSDFYGYLTLLDAQTGNPVRTAYVNGSTFSFRSLSAGSYKIRAEPYSGSRYFYGGRTLATATVVRVRAGEHLTGIAVEKVGGVIAGVVTDPDGRPVPSVRVYLDPADSCSDCEYASTLTDESGRYRFAGLAGGGYTLGYVPPAGVNLRSEWWRDKHTGTPDVVRIEETDQLLTTDVVLERGATVSGLVTYTDGSPIAGVDVSLNSDRADASATTDQNGVFTAVGLEPGQYSVTFWKGLRYWSYTGTGDEPVLISVAEAAVVTGIDTAVERGVRVAGRVVNDQDETIPNVWAHVWTDGLSDSVQSDDAGNFEFVDVPAGQYRLYASPTGDFVSSDTVVLTVEAGVDRTDVELRMSRAGYIVGKVVNPDGSPSPYRPVYFWRVVNGEYHSVFSSTSQYPDGRYSSPALPPGKYLVGFYGSTGWTFWDHVATYPSGTLIDVAGGQTVTDIDGGSLRYGSISGVVRGADGADVVGAVVTATNANYSSFSATTDAQGRYKILVPDGAYTVSVQAPTAVKYGDGFWPDIDDAETKGEVAIIDASHVADIDVTLPIVSGITGRLSLPAGVSNWAVSVQLVSDSTYKYTSLNQNGEYAFKGLPDGDYRLFFYSSGYSSVNLAPEWFDDSETADAASTVTVTDGEFVSGIDASMDSGASISGRIVDERGHPVSGVSVSVSGPRSAYSSTDSDGHYVVSGLNSGDYTVSFSPNRSDLYWECFDNVTSCANAQLITLQRREARTGVDAVLEDRPTVSGTVVDDDGLPVSGATVTLWSSYYGYAYSQTSTDSEGRYAFTGLSEQNYRLSVSEGADPWVITEYWPDRSSPYEAEVFRLVRSEDKVVDPVVTRGGRIAVSLSNGESGVTRLWNDTNSWYVYGDAARSGLLAPGQYHAEFTTSSPREPEFWDNKDSSEASDLVTVTSGEEVGLTAVFDELASIAGVVRGADGFLTGITVELQDASGSVRATTYTGEDGSYRFEPGLGTYRIRVHDDNNDYADQAWPADGGLLTLSRSQRRSVDDLTMEPVTRISGAVAGPDGQPVADVEVQLISVHAGLAAVTSTGRDGVYDFRRIETGDYLVRFVPGSATELRAEYLSGAWQQDEAETVAIRPGRQYLHADANLRRLGSVQGQVLDEAGQPVDATVELSVDGTLSDVTQVEADGSYRLSHLMPGTYTLRVVPSDESLVEEFYNDADTAAEANPIAVSYGDAITADVTVDTKASVAGSVRHGDAGLSDATVELRGDGGVQSATSGPSGDFVFERLTKGDYELEVSAAGFLPSTAQPVRVPRTGRVAVDVDLVPEAIIEGVVRGEDGSPHEGARVDLLTEQGTVATDWSSALGRFSFAGLEADSYVLWIEPTAESGYKAQFFDGKAEPQSATPVQIEAGERRDLSVQLEPKRRVSVPETPGAPTAQPADARVSLKWQAPADGNSEILYYEVSSTPPGASCSTVETTCEIEGLTNGQPYTFTVVAVNGIGPSASSDPSAAVTPVGSRSNVAPSASLVLSPDVGPAPLGTTIDVAAEDDDGDVLTFALDLGDGTPVITGDLPTEPIEHTYAQGAYTVVLTVYDGATATRSSSVVRAQNPEPPQANAGDDLTVVQGESLRFDAGASRPLESIETFEWSFGDGSTATGRAVDHVYPDSGTYTATLTVYADGRRDSDEVSVSVVEPTDTDGVRVTFEHDGSPVAGAEIVFLGPDGVRISATAGDDGIAILRGMPDGPWTLYPWAPGYLADPVQVEVRNGSGAAAVQVRQGDIAAATLDQRRLTLQEIIDRGIDVTDPDNQHVYEADINLAFGKLSIEPTVIVGDTGITCIDNCPTIIPGEPGGPGGGGPGGGGGDGVWIIGGQRFYPTVQYVGKDPFIQWLVIPMRASFLKEFFDVSLVVQNLASGMSFEQGYATLQLPEGLVLAPTPTQQMLSVTMPPIAAGSSQTASWTVRGDVEGEYSPNADYTAFVQPVGKAIAVSARTRDPIKVYAGSALELTVRAQARAKRWGPYQVEVVLKNVTPDAPVYNPTVTLKDRRIDAPDGQAQYFYAPHIANEQGTSVIEPGESWRGRWVLYPGIASEGDDKVYDLLRDISFIQRTGGNVDLKTNLEVDFAPALTGSMLPVDLKVSRGEIADLAELTWVAPDVPEGEAISGYEVWTRDLLASGYAWRFLTTTDEPKARISSDEIDSGRFFAVVTQRSSGLTYGHVVREGPAKYVALGDSFSSGEGVPEFLAGTDTDIHPVRDDSDEQFENTCHRSSGAYARLLARDPELATVTQPYVFAACSGAITDDFHHKNPGNDGELEQLEHVNRFTQRVTLTLGGNDINFAELAKQCLIWDCAHTVVSGTVEGEDEDVALQTIGAAIGSEEFVRTMAQGLEWFNWWKDQAGTVQSAVRTCATGFSNVPSAVMCAYHAEQVAKAAQDILDPDSPAFRPGRLTDYKYLTNGELRRRLVDVYSRISERAPDAEVSVVKYPVITKKGGLCEVTPFPEFPIFGKLSGWEREAIEWTTTQLNVEIQAAVDEVNSRAAAAGRSGRFATVQVEPAFAGKELCLEDGDLNTQTGFLALQMPLLPAPNDHPASFSFHPNATGQQAFADAVKQRWLGQSPPGGGTTAIVRASVSFDESSQDFVFDASASTVQAGTPTISWTFPDGSTATGAIARYRPSGSSAGAATVRVAGGDGAVSWAVVQIPGETLRPPGMPEQLSVQATGADVTAGWGQPPHNGGSPVDHYLLRWRVQGSSWTSVQVPFSQPFHTIRGLESGITYDVQVAAVNGAGRTGDFTPSSIVLIKGIPAGLTSLKAVPGRLAADITWSPPTNTGGQQILDYQVSSRPAPNGSWSDAEPTEGTSVRRAFAAGEHDIRVRARNASGPGPWTVVSVVIPDPPSVPDAPGRPIARAGDGRVEVSWVAPSDNGAAIDGYRVRSSPGARTCESVSTSCSIDGLVNGQEYTFEVLAHNAEGWSAASLASSPVTPKAAATVPGLPGEVRADVLPGGSVTFTWVAPAEDPDAPVLGYDVSDRVVGGQWRVSDRVSGTRFTTVLAVGSHELRVRAVNRVGAGDWVQVQVTVVPASTRPDPPSALGAQVADGKVTLSWQSGADNGAPVLEYRVSSSPGGRMCTTAVLTCEVVGLVNGTEYSFTVAARNSQGWSQESAAIKAKPVAVPNAPGRPIARAGDGRVEVSWVAPSDNGAAIDGYRVRSSPGARTCESVSTSCSIDGLVNGQEYTFEVLAHNAEGWSAASLASSPVTPKAAATVPGLPGEVRADVLPGGSVTFTWVAPAEDPDAPVLGYDVSDRVVGGQWRVSDRVSGTRFTTVLAVGSHELRVRAVNRVGAGDWVQVQVTVVPASTRPDPPSALGAQVADGKVTLSWQSGADNGAPVLEYRVSSSPGGRMCTTAVLTCEVVGLVNGTEYSFTVAARNSQGWSQESAAIKAKPVAVPNAPGRPIARAGDGRVEVSWVAPSDNGAAIDGYRVRSSPGARTCESVSTSCSIDGLVNGQEYTFEVLAHNAEGWSAASLASSPVTPKAAATVPGLPGEVRADVLPGGSVTFTWVAPAEDPDAPVLGYDVSDRVVGGQWRVSDRVSGTRFTTVLAVGSHELRVRAVNRVGAGDWVQVQVTVVPASTRPDPPSALGAQVADGKVTLSWQSGADNGAPVLEYRVSSSPGGRMCTTAVLTCEVVGLVNGTEYSFTVAARNSQGWSQESAAIKAKPVAPAPISSDPPNTEPTTSPQPALKIEEPQVKATARVAVITWPELPQAEAYRVRLVVGGKPSKWRTITSPRIKVKRGAKAVVLQIRPVGSDGTVGSLTKVKVKARR